MMHSMTTRVESFSAQFSLRSLLAGMMWLALLLAICVQYQQAANKQREAIEALRAAGMLPFAEVNGQPISSASRAAAGPEGFAR
jgi:hypothetical protein